MISVSGGKSMKKLVAVFTTVVALIMVSTLTVQAKQAETYQEKVERMINELEDDKIPAGKAYPNESYIYTGYGLRVGDREEFISELRLAVEEYNNCHEQDIEVNIDIMRDDYIFFVFFRSENLYYIENTPTKIGKAVYVREGEWNYWESSFGFGSGRRGTVKSGNAVIVTGVAYMDEDGKTISTNFNESEKIRSTELRMLHICSIEGDDLGWIWPLYLVDPHE